MLEYGAYSPALSTILCKCKRDSVISIIAKTKRTTFENETYIFHVFSAFYYIPF